MPCIFYKYLIHIFRDIDEGTFNAFLLSGNYGLNYDGMFCSIYKHISYFFFTDIVSNNLFLFTKIECKIRGR